MGFNRRFSFVALIILGVVAIAILAAKHPGATAASYPQGVVGTWRSPEFDGVWFTETFRDDGTVRTDYFATVNGKPRAFPEKLTMRRWRVINDVIQLGHTDDAGKFVQDGDELAIGFKNGANDSIGGLKRVATTRPAE